MALTATGPLGLREELFRATGHPGCCTACAIRAGVRRHVESTVSHGIPLQAVRVRARVVLRTSRQSALRAGSGVDLISVRIGISCLAVSVFVVQFVVPVYRRCILLLAVERPCQPSTENIVESGGMPSREEGGPPPRHEHSSETAQQNRSENRPLWGCEPGENDGQDRRTPVDRSRMTAVHHVRRGYDHRHSPCSDCTNSTNGGHDVACREMCCRHAGRFCWNQRPRSATAGSCWLLPCPGSESRAAVEQDMLLTLPDGVVDAIVGRGSARRERQ